MGLVGMIDLRNQLRRPVHGCIVHDDQLGHARRTGLGLAVDAGSSYEGHAGVEVRRRNLVTANHPE